MERNKLTEDEEKKFKKFHLWLSRVFAQQPSVPGNKFRPSEILLVLCGILEMDNAYSNSNNDNVLSRSSEKKKLDDIHKSLCRDNIFESLPEKGGCLKKINLMKPELKYLISSWYGTPPTEPTHFEKSTELKKRDQLEDALRAAMVSHLIQTYEDSRRLVVDRKDKRFPAWKYHDLKRKDERPNFTPDELFYFDFLDLDFTSYDGYTAAFCAAATCSHQDKEGKPIKKKGCCGKELAVMKYETS